VALATSNMLFLHIPKTGGMWVRRVFEVLEIPHWEIGDQHSHFPRQGEGSARLLSFYSEEYYKTKFIFTFVRHPLSWYQSRWAFRIKHGWRPMLHPLDYHCASNDFRMFMENVLKYRPTGWVTEEYNNYTNYQSCPINFIGKHETIVDDLIQAFRAAGVKVDENKIRKIPKVNDSDLDGKSSKYWAPYDIRLAERVVAADSFVVSKYYHNDPIPDAMIGSRPY
jgi:hypothetical protein